MKFIEDIEKQNVLSILDLISGKQKILPDTHKFYEKLRYKNKDLIDKIYLKKEIK